MKPLVSIHNMQVTLGGVEILKGVSADLQRGKITSVIGLNGCGKTTLLRALVKEIPYTGEVKFHCGHDHTHAQPDHIGYVPQKLLIEANLPITVADLLALALQKRPLFFGIRKDIRDQMVEMLRVVNMPPDLLEKPVSEISGGQRQRVLLALALHPKPELLLLDEPAAGIDFQDITKIYDLLARINEESGVTILLVSHDLSVVSKHTHHVLCMQDGQIKCQGGPQDIESGELLRETFGENAALFSHHH